MNKVNSILASLRRSALAGVATALLSTAAWAELSREQIVETVEASPAAVGIHDKQAWLDLFASDSKVQDPVGTEAHKTVYDEATGTYSKDNLEAFYNTFIAPNDITFHVHRDIVSGNEMVRDVDIETVMGSGLTVVVPAYLRYQVVEEEGEAKLKALSAHWELTNMIGQVLGDPAGIPTGAELALTMLEEQGVAGALGYLKGMTVGIFDQGKTKAERFADAMNSGSNWDLVNQFHWWQGEIQYPVGGDTLDLNTFSDMRGDLHLTLTDLRSAGFWTSGRFELWDNGEYRSGLILFKFDDFTRRIKKVRFYWED